MLTLTVAEIKDLAECAGLVLKDGCEPSADELETEITITGCPKDGVQGDDNKPTHYAHIAYFSDYPGEGCYPLGEELKTPNHNPCESATAAAADLRQLEQELAYSAARSDIECYCAGQQFSGQHHGVWYQSEDSDFSEEEKNFVDMGVRYLELKGLLKRHPDDAAWCGRWIWDARTKSLPPANTANELRLR